MYLVLTEYPAINTPAHWTRFDYVQSCYTRGYPAIVACPSTHGNALWHVTAECRVLNDAALISEAHTAIAGLFETYAKPTLKTKTRKGTVKEFNYHVGLLSSCPRIKQKHIPVVCETLYRIYSTGIHQLEQEPSVIEAIQVTINQIGLSNDDFLRDLEVE